MTLSQNALLKRYSKQSTDRLPIWFMRQAGRYLPEYRAIRSKHSMLECIRTAKIAAEITLQPLARFDLDAAIIFADILNPLMGMGIELDFVEKEGPKIFNPITSAESVRKLTVPNPRDCIGYTLDAIALVRNTLEPKGIPVLGFCGAPFTLASYMIEGGGSHALTKTKQFIFHEPEGWNDLMKKLVTYLVSYLHAQVEAGASAVQVFDTWVGYLSPFSFVTYVKPWLELLVSEYKKTCAVPIVYFSTMSLGLYNEIQTIPFDVISVDWRTTLTHAHSIFQRPIQGNLDPELINAPASVRELHCDRLLEDANGVPYHICNLGHGLLPHINPEQVEACITYLRKASTK